MAGDSGARGRRAVPPMVRPKDLPKKISMLAPRRSDTTMSFDVAVTMDPESGALSFFFVAVTDTVE